MAKTTALVARSAAVWALFAIGCGEAAPQVDSDDRVPNDGGLLAPQDGQTPAKGGSTLSSLRDGGSSVGDAAAVDTGKARTDTGEARVDPGKPRIDAGVSPPDTGAPRLDTGSGTPMDVKVGDAPPTADPQALPVVKRVLAMLHRVKAEGKIISGQQVGYPGATAEGGTAWDFSNTELDYIEHETGKRPAILGIDWEHMDRFPDRRSNTMRIAKAHAAAGGLVAAVWHERNPVDAESPDDPNGQTSWSSLSDGEWNDLVNTKSGTIYANWKHHMDLQVEWLLELQEANVPVLFRPYHEAHGGWFWWGGHPKQFQQLWRNTYDYLTKAGVHNALWVTTFGGDSEYYPGKAYVDVGGQDFYESDRRAATYTSTYTAMNTLFQGAPTAMTEVGRLPDLDFVHSGADYTWFVIWWGRFLDPDKYASAGPGGWDDQLNDFANVKAYYADSRTISLGDLHY